MKNLEIDNGEAFVIDYGMLLLIGYYNERFIEGDFTRDVYKKNVLNMINIRRKIRKLDFENLRANAITDQQFEINALGIAPFLDDDVSVEAYKKALEEFYEKNKDNKFLRK